VASGAAIVIPLDALFVGAGGVLAATMGKSAGGVSVGVSVLIVSLAAVGDGAVLVAMGKLVARSEGVVAVSVVDFADDEFRRAHTISRSSFDPIDNCSLAVI